MLRQQIDTNLQKLLTLYQSSLKTAFFGYADLGGCGFYRAYQPAKFLNEIYPIRLQCLTGTKLEPKLVASLNYFVLNRPHTPAFADFYFKFLANTSVKFIVDWDDWLLDIPPWNGARQYYLNPRVRQNLIGFLHRADKIIVSTPYLKDLIGNLISWSKQILICPNFIDSKQMFRPKLNESNLKIRIGYVGTNSHYGDLMLLKPVFNKLYNKFKKSATFVFLGPHEHIVKEITQDLPEEVIEIHPYVDTSRYIKYLYDLNLSVILFPLVDCDFNRAKSNIRFLEATQVGVPIIASPVGEFARTIKDGVNGFLATHEDEWIDKIVTIKNNNELAQKLVTNARDYVLKNFSEKSCIKAWAKALDIDS